MVGHQDPGVKNPASQSHNLFENLEKSDAVAIVPIDDPSLVPARRDVVDGPGEVDSQLT